MGTGEVAEVCPSLGLVRDPATACRFPVSQHVCYRGAAPVVVKMDYQAAHCLANFHACPIYLAAHRAASSGAAEQVQPAFVWLAPPTEPDAPALPADVPAETAAFPLPLANVAEARAEAIPVELKQR